MHLSHETHALIAHLRLFSESKLTREEDLGVLLDLSVRLHQERQLEDLSFCAKFVSRTYGIMKRIGRDGNGYDKLLGEFNENVLAASSLVRSLVSQGPPEVQEHFASTYLTMTPQALDNLLALFYDLSWYKNWLIDRPR
jgi:hypothetical protein